MRVLFCGDCFPASQSLLKERLPIGEDEIIVCNGINLRKALANCDVVIPMMTFLDEALMEAGSFRLVQLGFWTRRRGSRCRPRSRHLGRQCVGHG